MKLLLLPFLLLATALSSQARTLPSDLTPAVVDIDGHALIAGLHYYILPLGIYGGGLTQVVNDHEPCPIFVAQETLNSEPGLPAIFSPPSPTVDRIVREETDVNVEFDVETYCPETEKWRIGYSDEEKSTKVERRQYVKVDGRLGGKSTAINSFKIVRYPDGNDVGGDERSSYKLLYCQEEECREIGVFVKDGRRFLGLGGDLLMVNFKKVEEV